MSTSDIKNSPDAIVTEHTATTADAANAARAAFIANGVAVSMVAWDSVAKLHSFDTYTLEG